MKRYTLKDLLIDEICREIKPLNKNKDKFKKDLRKLTLNSLLDLSHNEFLAKELKLTN